MVATLDVTAPIRPFGSAVIGVAIVATLALGIALEDVIVNPLLANNPHIIAEPASTTELTLPLSDAFRTVIALASILNAVSRSASGEICCWGVGNKNRG